MQKIETLLLLLLPQHQIKEAFLQLAAADSTQLQDGLFSKLAAENPQLADEVRSLLKASEAGNVIEQICGLVADPLLAETNISNPEAETPAAGQPHQGMGEGPGTILGPYKLLEQIGEGGMGTVFQAQQSKPIRRKVALKIIKPGMDTGQVVARFEAERQALALMDHPNIAKVLDAGATVHGRPYFVMELVKGVPITDYCTREKLDTDQRLKLFIDVCHGVQHAHQKGIIHRDLKPSNILVTLHDSKPVVKIIDFGIAKAIDQDLTERTLFTQMSEMIGTPLYMSPEQAEVSGTDIDTRSDVYSLGVLLYELLTGTTPFDRGSMKKVGIDEVRRIIRETDPPKPSQRFSALRANEDANSQKSRSRDLKRSQLELQGELDWIVMKALEKERNRRYESASALAADVERYLNDEPVLACPPTLSYRLRKYTTRYRGFLTTAGTLVTMLIVATGVSISYAIQAEQAGKDALQARDDADKQKNDAVAAEELSNKRLNQSRLDFDRALKSLDTIVMEVSSAEFAQLPGVDRVRDEILEKAMKFFQEIIDEHDNDPHARGQKALALFQISHIHEGRGETSAFLEKLNEAIALTEELVEQNPDGIHFRRNLSPMMFSRMHIGTRSSSDRVADAERCLELTLQCKAQGDIVDATPLALLHHKVGEMLPTNSPRARQSVEKSIQITDDENLPPVPPAMIWLGDRAQETGNVAEAVRCFQRGIELYDVVGADPNKRSRHVERCLASIERSKLAEVLEKLGQTALAEETFRRAVTDARQLLREYHEMQWYREQFQYRLMQLTDFLDRHGRSDEGIAILDDVGHEFPGLESLSVAKGRRAEKDGKTDLAIQHFEAAILASPKNPRVHREFGEFYIRQGENQRAVTELDKCLELSPLQWWIIKRRGAAYFKLGNFQNSLDDLTRATEINPADVSTLSWIPVEDVAICPSREFRDGMLKLADRCVELNQESTASLLARSQLLAGLGALDKAREDLQKISAQDPGGYYQQYQTALLSLRLEDSDGYKSACQKILETTAETDPPHAKHFAVWTCALAKNALADYTSAVTFARAAVEAEPENPQFRNGLGAILMRADQYTEAKSALEKALAADEAASTSKTYVRYFLAMTEHHLGNYDAARLHLKSANELADAEVSGSIPSNRRLTIELLRKEAQTLIGDAEQ